MSKKTKTREKFDLTKEQALDLLQQMLLQSDRRGGDAIPWQNDST